MITAKQRAMLYDSRYQFVDAITKGTRTAGIGWLPGAFFPNAIERCIYSNEPLVVLERHEAARIGRLVTRTIARMMEKRNGNS